MSNGTGTGTVQNFTLTVDQRPVFTSAAFAGFTTGIPWSFTITATPGYPVASVTYGVDPQSPTTAVQLAALGLVLNSSTGVITGDVSAPPGAYSLVLDAANSTGTSTQNFTLNVLSPVAVSRRLDFGPAGAPAAPGFIAALAGDTLAVNGNQWTTPVQTFNTAGAGQTATPYLYDDFAWGTTMTQTLEITGDPASTYSIRIYAGDSRTINGSYTVLVRAYDSAAGPGSTPFTTVVTPSGGFSNSIVLTGITDPSGLIDLDVKGLAKAMGGNGYWASTVSTSGTRPARPAPTTPERLPSSWRRASATPGRPRWVPSGLPTRLPTPLAAHRAPRSRSSAGALPAGLTLNAGTGLIGSAPARPARSPAW